MKLYKGSVYPISVVYAPCYCDEPEAVEDLTLAFYTTNPESAVTFSGDSITISGMTATVVFQPTQTDVLEDGVLRFVSDFIYSGSPMTMNAATDKYLKTPPAYTPVEFVTDEELTERLLDYVDEAQLSDTLEDYSTSAQTQSAITEAQPKVYVLNLMSQEERAALVQELIQNYYVEGQNAPSSGFPVEDYQFYYYNQAHQDEGSGFIVVRLSKLTDSQANFEGILNGYVGRIFKELTFEVHSNGNTTKRENYLSVFTLDGQKGALTTKTINSNAILGTGDIEVGNIRSTSVNTIWTGTQQQYDAITTKDPNTLYFING